MSVLWLLGIFSIDVLTVVYSQIDLILNDVCYHLMDNKKYGFFFFYK